MPITGRKHTCRLYRLNVLFVVCTAALPRGLRGISTLFRQAISH
jgi:hypothetical protein